MIFDFEENKYILLVNFKFTFTSYNALVNGQPDHHSTLIGLNGTQIENTKYIFLHYSKICTFIWQKIKMSAIWVKLQGKSASV